MANHIYAVDLNLSVKKPEGYHIRNTVIAHVIATDANDAIIAAKAQIGPTVTAWQYGKENISVTVDGITAHQVRHKCTLGLS